MYRSTAYIGAACCYWPSSVVCRSVWLLVCLMVCHTSEPCKNGWTDRDAVYVEDSGGTREPLDGVQIPHGKEQFWGGKGRPILKYRETVQSSVQKWLNRSRCRLGFGLGWAQIIVLDGSPEVLRDVAMATNFWLLMGYNFGCMIASDMLFDFRGGFSGSSCPMKS